MTLAQQLAPRVLCDMQIAVATTDIRLLGKALELSQKLGLPLQTIQPAATFLLVLTPERLELREVGSKTGAVFVDFTARRPQQAQQQRERIARAVGIKGDYRPTLIDATAGLGQDAFVLAAAGAKVRMIERSSIIAALLEDGLRRAKEIAELAAILERLKLKASDAKMVLKRLPEAERPEVIYLDPMYPESGKAAAKRKEMRFFREIVGDDLDAAELLELARQQAKRRVVVKRPLKAPALGTEKPSAHIKGKTTRFDLYF